MIHNHEVPGSIPGLATETEKVEKLSPFFVLLSYKSFICSNTCDKVVEEIIKIKGNIYQFNSRVELENLLK